MSWSWSQSWGVVLILGLAKINQDFSKLPPVTVKGSSALSTLPPKKKPAQHWWATVDQLYRSSPLPCH